MSELRLTPETIGDNTYRIPLYQRLFEWDEERITQLLNDLREQPAEKTYYIGMLTSTSKHDLVDGQQRFTVMMLMGIALSEHYDAWKRFLWHGDELRLSFLARPEDQDYLKYLIKPDVDDSIQYKNQKMEKGLKCIKDYLSSTFESDEQRSIFAEYVYKHLTFFVSFLPENYRQSSLNKYFERMNSTGKNLEGHEIVKVKLLHKLEDEKEFYTKVWNRVAEMDTPLFYTRRWDNENESGLKERIRQAILRRNDPQSLVAYYLDGFKGSEDKTGSGKSIKDIKENPEAPSKNRKERLGTHSVMSFSDFLLQCLYRFSSLNGKKVDETKVFFNKANLQKTFEKYLLKESNASTIEEFFKCLLRYRILLDVYFVRILDGQGDYNYDLETPFIDKDDVAVILKMFESMLYVNSSPITYYQWFNWLMDIVDIESVVNNKDLYVELKSRDDEEHPKESLNIKDLCYGAWEIRYWFWRLDFQIWLKRKELFDPGDESTEFDNEKRKAIEVAEKYVFKRNRSVEHIAPQTPQQDDTLRLEDEVRNSFGNLVMISSEQNSALSNSIYQEKKARVQSFLDSSRSGSIESLKMLHAFTFNKTWSEEAIEKHGDVMFNLLLDSYDNNISAY